MIKHDRHAWQMYINKQNLHLRQNSQMYYQTMQTIGPYAVRCGWFDQLRAEKIQESMVSECTRQEFQRRNRMTKFQIMYEELKEGK